MRKPLPAALLALTGLLFAAPASAHVKWFSDFSFRDRPLSLAEVVTPTFWALALLSAAVVGALVVLDRWLEARPFYTRFNAVFEARRAQADAILRAATGASLLLSWQMDALLAPELPLGSPWLGWVQFAAAVLLVFGRTVPVAGALLLGLYGVAVARHGLFYLFDYAAFAGIGYALLVSRARRDVLRASALPALYATTGFALCWLALEKLVYPGWVGYVVAQNPHLALGLDPAFFVTAAAFVEFSLGFLLLVGVLSRPLAVAITLVFFTTTLVFGKAEVVGHTILHGALLVFLLEGPGRAFRPPIALHRTTPWRVAFASVNLLLVLGLMLGAYTVSARQQHAHAAEHEQETQPVPGAREGSARRGGAAADPAPHPVRLP